jgi:hypothetical protein
MAKAKTRATLKSRSELELILTENDLDPIVRGALSTKVKGRVLGGESTQILFDAIPGAIAKKIQSMIPKDFELRELEMHLSLGGKVFGVGLDGDVKVRFGPSKKG